MKYVIANWKMFGRDTFIKEWCQYYSEQSTIDTLFKSQTKVATIIAPPNVYMSSLKQVLPATMKLGAQNVSHFNTDGAHTGEVSASMLHDLGCEYVLVGHSERRALEGSENLREKVEQVLSLGMVPVFCVGEPIEERKAGKAEVFIKTQLSILDSINSAHNILLAYEPIWAIGTGQSADIQEIEAMHHFIKSQYPWPVLYGGSVKPDNAASLLNSSVIDGTLVGGASLKPDAFLSIVEAAS